MKKCNLFALICSTAFILYAVILLLIDFNTHPEHGAYSWWYYAALLPIGLPLYFIFKKALLSSDRIRGIFIAITAASSIIMEYVAVVHCLQGYYSWIGPVAILGCGLVFVSIVLLIPKNIFTGLEKH